MRYLVLYRPTSGEEGGMPDPAHMAQMGAYIEKWMKDGALIGTEPLTVRAAGAKVTLADGQYGVAEIEDRMAGYAFLQAPSREAVIDLCKDFLKVAGDGSAEIRQIMEFTPPPS